jgi:hypothetical protein
MKEEEIITYDGRTGRVTRSTVPTTTEEQVQQDALHEEEESQDSPFFRVGALETAIVKHVMQKVRQAQE